MFGVLDYICWAMGGTLTIFWIILLKKGKENASLFEDLDEKEYPLHSIYVVGYELLEIFKYTYRTKYDRKLRKELSVLKDDKYADYYIRVTRAQQVTFSYTLLAISFSMYGLTDSMVSVLVLIMFAFAAFYYYGTAASENIKKRSEEMLTDFSNVVSKLALLTNAGLIMKDAWEDVAYNGDTALYHEMQIACEEMKNGFSETEAIYRFGNRCIIPEIKKFASTIVQGIEKGNSELTMLLKQQSSEAWNIKRQIVKRQGEKASSKLLIPMLLMFVGILIMVIIPIFANLGV